MDVAEHFLNEGWEWFDVSCRCYVLCGAIADVLQELDDDGEFDDPGDDDSDSDDGETECA